MRIAAACVLALIGTHARADDDSGLIFGVGGGRSSIEYDAIGFDGEATAWKGLIGWRFNRGLSVEGAYIDAGSASDDLGGGVSARVDAEIWQASLVGAWWPSDNWSIYARAGANAWDAAGKVSNSSTSIAAEDDGTAFGWGVGVGGVWDNALFRLEYESIDIEEIDSATLISLSIVWRL